MKNVQDKKEDASIAPAALSCAVRDGGDPTPPLSPNTSEWREFTGRYAVLSVVLMYAMSPGSARVDMLSLTARCVRVARFRGIEFDAQKLSRDFFAPRRFACSRFKDTIPAPRYQQSLAPASKRAGFRLELLCAKSFWR